MLIVFKFKTEIGEFTSEEMNVTKEQYAKLIEMSRSFFLGGGYDMYLPNGFLVASPEIVKKSILIIEIIDDNE